MDPHFASASPASTAPAVVAPGGKFSTLYEGQFGFVLGVVRALGVSPRDCEDVVQEVWVKAYRNIGRLRDDASERAWLAALARRAVQHYRRGSGRAARKISAHSHERREVTNPHLRFERRQLADAILGQLNPDQRLAYVLVHGYGMSGAEASEAIGASVNTIYSRLRLAQKRIEDLCETSGISAELLADGWTPDEPRSPKARQQALALILVRAHTAKVATLGTWMAGFVVAVGLLALYITWQQRPSDRSAPGSEVVAIGVAESLDVSVPDAQLQSTPRELADAVATAEPVEPELTLRDPDLVASPSHEPAASAAPKGRVAHSKSVSESPLRVQGPQSGRHRNEAAEAVPRPRQRNGAATRSSDLTGAPAELEAGETPSTDAPDETTVAEPVELPTPEPAAADPRAISKIADGELDRLGRDVQRAARKQRVAWGRSQASVVREGAPPLAAETRLLREAKSALSSGNARKALAVLTDYRRDFPRGRLRDAASGLRVAALCKRGRSGQARKEAFALFQRSPSSPINAEVSHACW